MKRHQKTMVALSASPSDEAVIAYANMLAGLGFGKHFDFVHVRVPTPLEAELHDNQHVLQSCQQMVAAGFQPPSDVTFECHVRTGIRIDSLLEFITAHGSDMVLLGHRRIRSGQRSLAKRLAMIAPSSVWLVPEGAPVQISNVMAAIDFSQSSGDSLSVATQIAKAAGLPSCTALHVYFDQLTIRYDERAEEIRLNEQQSFDTFVASLNLHDVNVIPQFMEGNNVARTILYAAAQQQSDLLVMNTRGRSQSASILLGSVTSQVMTETPVSMLAVKHYGAMMNLFEALRHQDVWNRKNPKTN